MTKTLVLIPTYNRGRFVVEAVESALAQTHTRREVLVVDDGSTDDTHLRLEPYLDRISYVRQANRGRSVARNRAIESDAEYVAFLDSDDVWLPDKLERQVRELDAEPAIGLVHGHVEVIDDHGRVLAEQTTRHRGLWTASNAQEATYARFALHCRCLTSTVMVRRSVFADAGGYDSRFDHLEDLDLYLRILLRSSVRFIGGAPLTRYRWHEGQSDNLALARAQIAVAQKHLELVESVPNMRIARRNLEINVARAHHLLLEPKGVRGATRRAGLSALFVPGVLRRYLLSFAPRGLLRHARQARA
ncbi:MAG: glycosyl transferase family 2 [bacterium]|nr:glycosyl transferase family 2 [bacterium]